MATKNNRTDQEKLKIAMAALESVFYVASDQSVFEHARFRLIKHESARALLRIGNSELWAILHKQMTLSITDEVPSIQEQDQP